MGRPQSAYNDAELIGPDVALPQCSLCVAVSREGESSEYICAEWQTPFAFLRASRGSLWRWCRRRAHIPLARGFTFLKDQWDWLLRARAAMCIYAFLCVYRYIFRSYMRLRFKCPSVRAHKTLAYTLFFYAHLWGDTSRDWYCLLIFSFDSYTERLTWEIYAAYFCRCFKKMSNFQVFEYNNRWVCKYMFWFAHDRMEKAPEYTGKPLSITFA